MAFRPFKPEYRHTLHGSAKAPCKKNGDDRCIVCDGGLGWCVVCGGAEASMPTNCPGRMMSAELQDLVTRGTLDHLLGEWVLVEAKLEQPAPPLPHDREAFLKEFLGDAVISPRLSDWEVTFCEELRDRVDRYSIWTEISPRQWEIVDQIDRKLSA